MLCFSLWFYFSLWFLLYIWLFMDTVLHTDKNWLLCRSYAVLWLWSFAIRLQDFSMRCDVDLREEEFLPFILWYSEAAVNHCASLVSSWSNHVQGLTLSDPLRRGGGGALNPYSPRYEANALTDRIALGVWCVQYFGGSYLGFSWVQTPQNKFKKCKKVLPHGKPPPPPKI